MGAASSKKSRTAASGVARHAAEATFTTAEGRLGMDATSTTDASAALVRPRFLPGVEILRRTRASTATTGGPLAGLYERFLFATTSHSIGVRFRHRGREWESPPNRVVSYEPGEAWRAVNPPRVPIPTEFDAMFVDANLLGVSSLGDIPTIDADPGSFVAFRQLVEALDDKASDRLELTEALTRFACALGLTKAPKAQPSPKTLGRVRDRICSDVSESASVTDLAFDAGLSREHLVRAFASCFGMPPHEYRMHIRVERARAMLARGASATEVACACGFADQSHLNRWFKKVVGVTPGQYARAVA